MSAPRAVADAGRECPRRLRPGEEPAAGRGTKRLPGLGPGCLDIACITAPAFDTRPRTAFMVDCPRLPTAWLSTQDRRSMSVRAFSGVDDRRRTATLRLAGNDTGNDFAPVQQVARAWVPGSDNSPAQPVTSDRRGATKCGHSYVPERKAAPHLEQISCTCSRVHGHRGARRWLLFDSGHTVPDHNTHTDCWPNTRAYCSRTHCYGSAHQRERHHRGDGQPGLDQVI
jgi:hypothetical protein